jgi:hypothetical protein
MEERAKKIFEKFEEREDPDGSKKRESDEAAAELAKRGDQTVNELAAKMREKLD